MGKFRDLLYKRLYKKELADPLHANMERPTDIMLTATLIENTSDDILIFTSTLEEKSDLLEGKAWHTVTLQPGEKLVFPHLYFNCSSQSGRDCSYKVSGAPKGSDFIYQRRF